MSHSFNHASITIELGRSADAARIAELSRDEIESGLGWSWRAERVRAAMRAAEDSVVVARSGEVLAGFAVMRFLDAEARLNLLAVAPGFRRRGVGRKLVSWLEKCARVAGIEVIYLEVRETNVGAQQFYRSLGYRVVENVDGYYLRREAALRMARDLLAARGC